MSAPTLACRDMWLACCVRGFGNEPEALAVGRPSTLARRYAQQTLFECQRAAVGQSPLALGALGSAPTHGPYVRRDLVELRTIPCREPTPQLGLISSGLEADGLVGRRREWARRDRRGRLVK